MLPRIRTLFCFHKSRTAYRFHLRYWFHPDAELAAGILATQRASRALRPEISEGPDSKRIVVIAPHPDDEVIGPGGTLLRAQARGSGITIVFLTDGEPIAEKAASRRAEAEQVCDRLGFSSRFLGLPSGMLSASQEAIGALGKTLADLTPDILFLPFMLDDNDDHRAASYIFASVAETFQLNRGLEIWAYQVYSALPANLLVPLGEFAGRKVEAIRMYESQSEVRDWAHFALGLNAYNTRLAPRACMDPYLEAFFVIPLRDYLDLTRSFTFAARK